MINIQTQCCGLLILFVITIFYKGMKRMEIRTQKAFWNMLVVANICIIADIVSVFAIYYRAKLPDLVVAFSCKFYLVTLMALAFMGFVYICSDFILSNKKHTKTIMPFLLITLMLMVAVMVSPISLVCEKEGAVVYSSGPATIITYVGCFSIIMLINAYIIIGWHKMNPRRIFAVITWIVIWILAAAIQFFFPQLLVVGFAGCTGVIIIYMMIENPEANIDKYTGLYNTSAMVQYINQYYANEMRFAIICTSYRQDAVKLSKRLNKATLFIGGGEIFFLFTGENLESDVQIATMVLEMEEYRDFIYIIPDSNDFDGFTDIVESLRVAQDIPKKDLRRQVFTIDAAFKKQIVERKKIQTLIREAISDDRVVVYYQPIYSTKDGKFNSAEALVRIKDKSGKLIAPGLFIPVAEDDGMIIELGRMVFDKVCSFLERHDYQALGLKCIESNLSVVQGEDDRLVEDIIETIQRHNIPASAVKLEITESASLRQKELLISSMKKLMEHGIEFVLDDFGTGQSNLDYVADMPVGIVKFDKNMTQGYFTTKKIKHIMHASIQMIHDMGMQIVVEGIENLDQCNGVLKEEIEYIQGYYFSKPLSEEDFVIFLKNNNKIEEE